MGFLVDIVASLQQIFTDPLSFYQFFGILGLSFILFAETGLFGFFLPGDSLLVTLGLIASQGQIDLHSLIPALTLATIAGDFFSYFLGLYFRPFVEKNMTKLYLEKEHLVKAREFYDRHGGKTILFCKFIAFVRTFAPFIAGTTQMNFLRFVLFDICGAILWVPGIILTSYYFGKTFQIDITQIFHYFVFVLGALIILPFLFKFIKKRA